MRGRSPASCRATAAVSRRSAYRSPVQAISHESLPVQNVSITSNDEEKRAYSDVRVCGTRCSLSSLPHASVGLERSQQQRTARGGHACFLPTSDVSRGASCWKRGQRRTGEHGEVIDGLARGGVRAAGRARAWRGPSEGPHSRTPSGTRAWIAPASLLALVPRSAGPSPSKERGASEAAARPSSQRATE